MIANNQKKMENQNEEQRKTPTKPPKISFIGSPNMT